MPHHTTIQTVLEELPLVTVASYDLLMKPEHAAAFEAGALKLMLTKAGISTKLVDSSHKFVGEAGLVQRVGVSTGTEIMVPPRNLVRYLVDRPALPAMAVVAGVVLLGAAGAYLFLHLRKEAKLPGESYNSGDERVLADAEEIVDAESVRLRQAVPNAVVAELRQLHLLMTDWVRRL